MQDVQTVAIKPPSSDTGVQNTSPPPKRALVDWVSATFMFVTGVHNVIEILGFDRCKFVHGFGGKFGYKKHCMYGHIFIYYDGNDNMGMHLEMGGQACREFELLSDVPWDRLLSDIVHNGKLTRLDVAIDEFDGVLSLKTMRRAVKDGLVTSRFKKAKSIQEYELKTGNELGSTLYFGSPLSMIQVRVYDKYQERLSAGKEVEEGITHWVRVEVQLRDERANNFAKVMIFDGENTPLGSMIAGLVSEYITFRSSKDGLNRSRWPVAKYWSKFIDGSSGIKLSPIAPDRTIERSYDWLDRQAKVTLASLFEAFDESVDFISDWIESGIQEMTEKEWMMVHLYKEKKKAQQQLLDS